MRSLGFPTDPLAVLVADASVVINLNATARAADIVRALPNLLVVTENSFNELKSGASNGCDDAEKLEQLIALGVISIVVLGGAGAKIYGSLIEGSALRTLDDGEAATIGSAHQSRGVAVIDERIGRSICAASFPELLVASTVDLLTHKNIAKAFGRQGQTEATRLGPRQ
jgi:hypothetical protein